MNTSAGTAASPAGRSRALSAALWIAQIALALMFIMAGGSKLAGVPEVVEMFGAIGLGQWFRYLTGGIEVLGSILILVPSLAFIGALLLTVTMVGAVVTHLFVIGGSPLVPLVLLTVALVVAWARRPAERT